MRFLASTALAFAVLGCTHAVDTPDAVELDDTGARAALSEPADVDSTRLYVGDENAIALTGEQPFALGVFDLNARARVRIDLTSADADPGFKVYAVDDDGSLWLLGAIDGHNGHAAAILRTRDGGTYAVESAASSQPASLALDIECRSNFDCTPHAQPGELCADDVDTCDVGLWCDAGGVCPDASSVGFCERPAEICAAVAGPPVCGCDGRTYESRCAADSAGMNAVDGACACDPLVFNVKVDGVVDVTGDWIGTSENEANNLDSRLSLRADGTFRYQQVWNPKCLTSVPACRIMSRMFSMEGTWENQGFAVQLTPVGDAPDVLAQSFSVATNCEGAVQLSTTETNIDRTLSFDRCSTTTCNEGEHCELVQVTCIRAPCNPVPECIAN